MNAVELSSVLVAVKVRLDEFSATVDVERWISVGASFAATELIVEVTDASSVSVILALPVPGASFSALAADLT